MLATLIIKRGIGHLWMIIFLPARGIVFIYDQCLTGLLIVVVCYRLRIQVNKTFNNNDNIGLSLSL